MKIKNKKMLGASLALLMTSIPITLGTISIINNVSNSSNLNENVLESTDKTNASQYIYDGQYFDSLDDATNYAISKNKAIDSKLYTGNIYDAIFDNENKLLDINELREYDKSKLYPAYKNSLNQYTHDFKTAKSSFINPGLMKIKYDAFNGKLYDSKTEATHAIKSSTNANPIGYYEIDNHGGENFLFNPLNKDDLKGFKYYALEAALKASKNKNSNNPFSINGYFPMDETLKYEKDNSLVEFNNDPGFLNTFIKDTVKNIIKKINNKIVYKYTDPLNGIPNNIFWDVDVRMYSQFTDSHEGRNEKHYEWVSSSHELKNKNRTITFKNQRHNELDGFGKFLNVSTFTANHNTSIKKAGWRDEAREAKSKDDKYEIKYVGTSGGWYDGIDVDILQAGSWWQSELNFEVTFKPKFGHSNSNSDFINIDLEDIVNDFDLNLNENLKLNDASDYVKTLTKNIYDLIKPILLVDYNNKPTNNYDIYKISLRKGYPISSIPNYSLFNVETKIKDEDIDKFINNIRTDIKYIINYNGNPLFEIPKKEMKYIRSGETDEIDLEKVSSKLKNVSGKLKSNNPTEDFNICENFTRFEVNPVGEIKDTLLPPDDGKVGTLDVDASGRMNSYKTGKRTFEFMIDAYNKKTHVSPGIKADDIIVLYEHNKGDGPNELAAYYSEYLSSKSDTNKSLWQKNNQNLHWNRETLDNARQSITSLNPAAISILYDLLGNIVNPGVSLSENEEEILTNSDAIYDSESTIIDNLFRTKLLKNDINKTFYLDSKDKYTLLDNETNLIYVLNWDSRKYYFPSHKDSWKYMYDIIKRNSIKVEGK